MNDGDVDSTPDAALFDDEDGEETDEFTFGKRRPVKLADIARAGNLEAYRLDLKQDIAALDRLYSNLTRFQRALDAELRNPRNHQSRDTKLEALMAQIQQKRQSGCNGGNQKVLIFTVFKDTAFYLFEQLKQRGFRRIAVVSGSESQTDDADTRLKDFEPILERFAPYTKLFKEKEWNGFRPHPPAPSPKERGSQDSPPLRGGVGGGVFRGGVEDGVVSDTPRFFHTTHEYWKILKEFARDNRKNPTEAEELLWQHLRNQQLGYRIRRQHAIGEFIVDFVCIEKQLVIEVDGDIHEQQQEYDEARTAILEQYGFRVIRFSNTEVTTNLPKTLRKIREMLTTHSENLTPGPSPKERGETPLSEGEGPGVRSDFEQWKIWVSERDPHVKWQLDHPIDLLIATDCLSEGQNLQDCDFVVNYDIHWNPVRVIQRMGRIDRLGSPNSAISGLNFWPSENINAYLNLQDRIENRMITMRLAGAEVDKHFTDTLAARIEDEQFEQAQNARMLEQMQISWEDIEVSDQSLGFENLSLEAFRQDLAAELRSREDFYRNMPKGLYTGFRKHPEICQKDGIIALLGYPAKPGGGEERRYAAHDLIYIDNDGQAVILNQQGVLEALAQHKDLPRSVPDAIDSGEPDIVAALRSALTTYLSSRVKEEERDPEGAAKTKMGTSARDVLEKLKRGDLDAVKRLKQHETIEESFQPDRVELIVWFVVN